VCCSLALAFLVGRIQIAIVTVEGKKSGGEPLHSKKRRGELSVLRLVEEDDVGRAPHGGGNGAVGLAGYDDLKEFG
jgi:hypothetical protein